jgi:hypothetical protein
MCQSNILCYEEHGLVLLEMRQSTIALHKFTLRCGAKQPVGKAVTEPFHVSLRDGSKVCVDSG